MKTDGPYQHTFSKKNCITMARHVGKYSEKYLKIIFLNYPRFRFFT